MPDMELRVCKSWDDCLQCEELQQRVWETPDLRDVVPAHLLITAVKNGGLLIGAFDGPRMVGFAFGFLGSEGKGSERLIKHTSHMLAVLPDARRSGLGAALKWKQRAAALEQGVELMTWTYDPLQAVNARLNLVRLGAVGRRYIRDAYGVMTDALNRGIPSDRFEVEWFLSSTRVRSRDDKPVSESENPDGQAIFTVGYNTAGLPLIRTEAEPADATILVEIPPSINELRAADLGLAADWRERTRRVFENAFAQGYIACGFDTFPAAGGQKRNAYVLMRTDFASLTQSPP